MMTADLEIGLAGKAALVLSSIFIAIGLFTIGLVLPVMSAAVAADPHAELVPWIGSVAAPAFALSSPVAGFVVARFGYRQVYLASILLWVASGTLPALVEDLGLVLTLRVLLGISVAGALTAALDGIAHLPEQQRPTLFGVQALFGSLSAVAAFPLVGLLAKSGWHLPFAVHLIGLLVVPLVLTLPRSASEGAAAHRGVRRGALAGVSPALCLFAGLVGVTMFILQLVAPYYLVSIGIADPALAAVPLTAMAFASMVAAGSYGQVHRVFGTTGTFLSVTLVIGLGLLICASAGSLSVLSIGAVLMGGGISIAAPNLYSAALANRDGPPGPALGVVNAAIYLAPLVLPVAVGPVNARLGAGGIFLVFSVLMLACAATFTVLLARGRPARAIAGRPAG